MYAPETCPVCDEEYEEALKFEPLATAHSGNIDSKFCLMAGDVYLFVYRHSGDIAEL